MKARGQFHRSRGRFAATTAVFFLASGLVWAGFWSLSGLWFPTWNPIGSGVAAFWATLVVLIATAVLWGRRAGRRRPDVFGPFNEAFLRIARGDYTVKIPTETIEAGGPGIHFQTLAENLNAMAGALAKVEDLRRRFVADVSHEFQSPLTSILGFSQALRSEALPGEIRLRYLGIIESEARRLSRLAEVLLRLNALEDREGPPDPVPFRLDVQLRRVLVALEPQWAAKGLEIGADLAEVEVVGNEELWTQVWTNLLHNAIKFTPAGGFVTVRLGGHGPVVEVEDSGVGLAPGEDQRIFERFYKAEDSRSYDGVSGSGLGLALAQRIVTLHGATIKALSPGLGKGTTLRVSFPSGS